MPDQRRSRASCSPELEAVINMLAGFSEADLMLARAMRDAHLKVADACFGMGISREAGRQRLCTLVRRVRVIAPGFHMSRGGVGHEVSYDQYEGVGYHAGITDHGRED